MVQIRRVLGTGLALIVMIGLLAGCRASWVKSDRAHEDWSRGIRLGQAAISDQIGLAFDASKQSLYLVWAAEHERNGAEFLHFVHLDRSGRIIQQRDLPIGVDRPSEVRLTTDAQDNLHLTWVDRLAGVSQLFYASLDPKGGLVSYPMPVSLPGTAVEGYAVGLNPRQELEIVWGASEGENAGLYHLRLNRSGQVIAENLSLSDQGLDPDLSVDREGRLHLVWAEEPDFGERRLLYATLDGEERGLGARTEIATMPALLGMVEHRPVLGLTDDEAYVFWSIERRGGGLSQPMAESYYTVFPLGSPRTVKPQQVHIPALNHPEYERTTSGFDIHSVADYRKSSFPAQFVYLPSIVEGQSELATAFSVQIVGRTKQIIQIVLALWDEGEIKGYQIVGQTRNTSLWPVLLADSDKDLHLCWIDTAGFGQYDIYYAATSPEARAALDRLTAQDVLAVGLNLLWGGAQALSFLPIVIVWFFLPLALLAIYVFIRAEADLSHLGTRIMFIVAILAYAAFKYLFQPNWLAALPLPAGLPLDVANALTYAMPFIITTVAGLLAWLLIRRREYASALVAFAFFGGLDALLTLLIYVPGILAE